MVHMLRKVLLGSSCICQRLSGGEKQRLAFARAVLCKPRVGAAPLAHATAGGTRQHRSCTVAATTATSWYGRPRRSARERSGTTGSRPTAMVMPGATEQPRGLAPMAAARALRSAKTMQPGPGAPGTRECVPSLLFLQPVHRHA